MKVGILTYHNASSYGAMLQAYALQEVLRLLGHNSTIVNYRGESWEIRWLKLLKCRSPWGFISTLNGFRMYGKIKPFVEKFMQLTRYYDSAEALKASPPGFDAYICGSDQVWHPQKFETDGKIREEYFLSFAEPGTRKIAYAPSFGHEPGSRFLEAICPLLEDFAALSVREPTGAAALSGALGRTVPAVCDPTFLLGRTGFEKLISGCGEKWGDYIFCFLLGHEPGRDRHVVKDVAHRLRCPVVIASRLMQLWGCGENCIPDIPTWVDRMNRARFVITNSFHGLSFCILFHRPFVSLPWRREQQNIRCRNLLRQLGLSRRMVDLGGEVDEIVNEPIDWGFVDEKVEAMRQEGLDFLRLALG